jgi:hypothetical protein
MVTIEQLIRFVESSGGVAFSNCDHWRAELDQCVRRTSGAARFRGTLETEQERRVRVLHELVESKAALELNLDKRVDFVCWPAWRQR